MNFKGKQILTVFSKPELLADKSDKEALFKDYKRFLLGYNIMKYSLLNEMKTYKKLVEELNYLNENIDKLENEEITVDTEINNNQNEGNNYRKYNTGPLNMNNFRGNGNNKIVLSSDMINFNKRIRRRKEELERNFVCKFCGNRYGSNNNMQQHIRLKHT